MRMLNDGKKYQEQWLIPETDVTDPVLCSQPSHWLSVLGPAAAIVLVLFVCLWACAMMVRRYPIAWVLIIGAVIGAGSLLYRQIMRRTDERLIVTSRHFIMIPGFDGTEMSVTKLNLLQSLTVHQNIFEKILRAGKIELLTEDKILYTPLIPEPELTAVLIRYFSEQASCGRPVLLKNGSEPKRHTIPDTKKDVDENNADPLKTAPAASYLQSPKMQDARKTVPNFKTIEFRAHWALLVKMLIKPLLVLLAVFLAAKFFRTAAFWPDIKKILLLVSAAALTAVVYQFFSWRNHRFYIEEDRVRDYSRETVDRGRPECGDEQQDPQRPV